jgi:hypothetical protein
MEMKHVFGGGDVGVVVVCSFFVQGEICRTWDRSLHDSLCMGYQLEVR